MDFDHLKQHCAVCDAHLGAHRASDRACPTGVDKPRYSPFHRFRAAAT